MLSKPEVAKARDDLAAFAKLVGRSRAPSKRSYGAEEGGGGDRQTAQYVARQVPAEHQKQDRDREDVGRRAEGTAGLIRAGATSVAASAMEIAPVACPLGNASMPT